MKKILLLLTFISSFLFSDYLTINNTCYNLTYHHITNYANQSSYTAEKWVFGTYAVHWSESILVNGKYNHSETSYTYSSVNSSYCSPPVPTCTENQHLENNVCVANSPTCTTGSHLDTALNVCVSDFEQTGKTTFDNGDFLVSWADGANTFCYGSPSVCFTYDKGNKNRITNRYLNPEFNTDGTIKYDGAFPDEAPVKTTLDYILEPIGNTVGKTLQAFGMGIILTGTGGGALMYDGFTGLNALNPAAVFGASLITLGDAMVTDKIILSDIPNTNNDVNVNLIEKPSTSKTNNYDNFSPDGVYTKATLDANNIKTVWDTAGGVGKLPPNALILGSDIIYPNNNPSTALVNTPDKLIFVETKPDTSAITVEIAKSDLANTSNNNVDLPYTQKTISAPTLQTDGSITQTVTSVDTGISSTSNGLSTVTNSTTGSTSVLTPSSTGTGTTSTTTTTPTGSSTDLSSVTTRLDTISRQLTKQNDFFDKLDKATASEMTNPIPSDASAGDWASWSTTWDNLKSDLDSVTSKGEELKTLVNGGLTLALTSGDVLQCSKSYELDLIFTRMPVEIDLCSTLSTIRPVIYFFLYISLVISIIFFTIKTLFRLV